MEGIELELIVQTYFERHMLRTATFTRSPLRSFASLENQRLTRRPSGKQTIQQQRLSEEQRLNELFERVVCLPAHERPLFLDKNCYGLPDLRYTIEELLKGTDKTPPDHFLDPSRVMGFLIK